MNKLLLALLISISAIGLTACGGGGGGGGSSSAPAPTPTAAVTVPLTTAIANSVNNSLTKSLTVSGWYLATSSTLSGSGNRNVSAGIAAVVNGVSYLKQTGITTGTATISTGGTLNLNSTGVSYVSPSTYATAIIDDVNPYAVFAPYTYPATVSTGDAGQFATATLYTSSAKTTQSGTLIQTYQVLANTADSVTIKVISNVYNMSAQQTLQSISTQTVTTTGAMTPIAFEQYRYAESGRDPYYIKFTFQ